MTTWGQPLKLGALSSLRSLNIINLNDLNAPQREAAGTIDGPVLILAGAGSGKTRTITYRIAYMIENLGIDPSIILGVTFTNKAAKEMKERVAHLIGTKKAKSVTLATFHSLCVRILQKEIDKLGYNKNFSIYDTSDQLSIVREALQCFKDEKKYDKSEILSKIGFLKNQGIGPETYKTSRHYDATSETDVAAEFVYNFYQDKLLFYNAIDFDDILFLTTKLFRENPALAEEYSRKFRYIMVDEYQDTNPLQFQVILALTATHNNLCVVGDDDQSIYAFRGADISNILNFEKYFSGAKVVKLEENYRSYSGILALANHVIKENKKRKEKSLFTQKQTPDLPLLWAMGNSEHEAQSVAEEINAHRKKGHSLTDIAILYRSNTQAPLIEEQLRMNDIPYALLGGQKFYDKKEIKDLIAYLLLIENTSDELALRRIINVPHRGIGQVTLKKYLERASTQKMTLFKTIEVLPAVDPNRAESMKAFTALIRKFQQLFKMEPLPMALGKLIAELNYYDYIDRQYDNAKLAEVKRNDVDSFIRSAERFMTYENTNHSLKDFIERVLLKDSQDKEDEEAEQKNEVTMMTLHSSKGLEFDIVYLMGMEEETLPHKRTIAMGEDIDEERRLCYVGITRARKKLVMTYCKERTIYGKKVPRHKSRFVKSLEGKKLFIEQDRTTFGHLTPEEVENYKQDFFANLLNKLGDD